MAIRSSGVRLPVEEIREELESALEGSRSRVLLRAPTGSGKSTVVPGMMLEGGVAGRILVVQPRRIAARMLAEFVARLRGGKVGAEVGYAVRFDTKYGKETRVVYLTDGVLQRWMKEEPGLPGVGAVVFDEFHERRLASDIALARVLDLQDGKRDDLKVVVMSATLETAGLRDYLEPCVELETGGRLFPVEIEHRPEPAPKRGRHGRMETVPVWERVGEVLRGQLRGLEGEAAEQGGGSGEGTEGRAGGERRHGPPRVLVFLPGAFEIRRTVEMLEKAAWARGWEVKPLYSALPPKRQWEAVGPGETPRIIVSTNVAETSITIEGVRLVVDSGLARQASYDPRRGIDTLTIRKVSRAAAEQRAGRAGRTGPGRCVRLWSAADHGKRAEFERPEVRRVDLAEAVLYLLASGVEDIRRFRWLDAPEEEPLRRAEELLEKLGATAEGAITGLGTTLARFPLHPRQAALLVAAAAEDCVEEACFAAAVLQAEGIFARGASRAQRTRFQLDGDRSDFEAEWRGVEAAESCRFDPGVCAPLGVHAKQAREVMRVWEQLCGMAQREGLLGGRPGRVHLESRREALGRAMLQAYR
ncbi:MAG: ATP-dependent RNA helicase, partial [Akkermansiaceae bacterium]|nr:ATP-dependent RNA helicase [Akkermansiaceae bacterium]